MEMDEPDEPEADPLPPGTVVGGRFTVEGLATRLGLLSVHHARDQKTQRLVALWLIPAGALPDAHVEATRKSVRAAASVQHAGLIAPFGTSVLPDGTLCVATEPLGDSALADIIDARTREGRPHSPIEAYEFVANVTTALDAAHGWVAHGAIAPEIIRFDGGKVRLAGLGLLTPLVLLDAVSTRYVAPEVRNGQTPTPASDVYSVGVVLYELLTNKPFDRRVRLSEAAPGLPITIEVILENCVSPDPDDRFESMAEVQNALGAVVSPDKPAVVPRRAAPGEIPVVFEYPDAGDIPVVFEYPDPSRASDADLGSLLQVATTGDADRWMFSHGGLDHGPVSARELIAAIIRHEAMADDPVTNMETGERRKLRAWPQYLEFVETATDKRNIDAHQAATSHALVEAGHARRGKAIITGAIGVALLMVGGVFWFTVGPGGKHKRTAAEIDSLIARGELRVQTTSIVLLPPPPPSARRSGGGGGGGHGGGSMTYESAMAQPIDFNFAGGGGPAGGTLSDAEIVRPLNGALSRFAGCLGDGSARNVTLRIAIGGNGRAMGVTVNNGSAGVKGCVAGTVRSLSWRSFGGPRIGLSWGFGF
jgi:serine/threonine protein kinase